MINQLCLACKKVLFKKGLLDARGHVGKDPDSGVQLESDGNDSFYRCPHCGAKNVVVRSNSAHGLPQLKFTHVKP